MFSKDITGSDAFRDMPGSTQALYFHLGMDADDDGFLGGFRTIIRGIGCSEDDFKILLGKKFVVLFPSGVLVIKHHRINNKWDKHNCKRTVHQEEFSQLYIKENRAYTLDKTQSMALQSVSSLFPVSRIEENRIEEKRIDKIHTSPAVTMEFEEFWKAYPRKIGKGAAVKAWSRAIRKTTLAVILAAIANQRRSSQWVKDDGQFIPHPSTWLNAGRWDDEIAAHTSKIIKI